MTETGSRIVQAIEAAWRDIQAHHAEVPDVVAITGSGLHQKGNAKWAHFWALRWKEGAQNGEQEKRHPELFVSGQLLALPGRRILQTLVHEAAHALNFSRRIQDCNVNGRHNKKFVAAAVELGLEWPEGEQPHTTIGFSAVVITDATAEKYASTIDALEAAHLAYLDDLATAGGGKTGGENGGENGGRPGGTTPGRGRGGRGGTRGGKRINVVCECEDPDPFPISPGRLARKPIKCGDCDAVYRPQNPDEQGEQDEAA